LATFIRLVPSNFTVTFFVIGLVVSGIAHRAHAVPRTRAVVYESHMAHGNAGAVLYTDS